jgi:hypothetical protein
MLRGMQTMPKHLQTLFVKCKPRHLAVCLLADEAVWLAKSQAMAALYPLRQKHRQKDMVAHYPKR